MFISTLFACVLVTMVSSQTCLDDASCLQMHFRHFKQQYSKSYKNETEELYRMMIFDDNQKRIDKHNERYEANLEKYGMEMNEFGDMLLQEFLQGRPYVEKKLLDVEPVQNEKNDTKLGSKDLPPLPPHVDWRKHGAVSRVRNESRCRASWAFAAAGSLEAQHFRHFGTLVELSAQNLVDCVSPGKGCYGNLSPEDAINYIKINEGVDKESSYLYEGKDDKCRFSEANIGATSTGSDIVAQGSERKLQEAVAHIGPMYVNVDGSHDGFKHYRDGIYYQSDCSSTNLNHQMLVVGYGSDPKGQEYWIAKNSWGTNWGMDGYILLARNRKNNCGVATHAGYAKVLFAKKSK